MTGVLLLAAVVALAYGSWWLRRRFGVAGWWFVAAAWSFFVAAGVAAERWLGPAWSWNFAHHGTDYAIGEVCLGMACALIGVLIRSRRRAV
jgi:hypothetical protein